MTPAFPPAVSAPPRPVFWLLAFVHLVCPLLFFTDLTRNPYFTQISLLQAGLCLALLVVVLSALRAGTFAAARTPLDGPLLIFLAVALASWALSWWDHPPFRLPVWNEGKRVTLFLVVNCLLAFWLAVQVKDPAWDERFQRLALAVGVAAGMYGVLQYSGREIIWPKALDPYGGRPVSTFGNPNFLSSYLVLLLPAALDRFLRARTARRAWGAAALFLTFSAAIICTMTRSSWIGGAVAAGVFLGFAKKLAWERRRRLGLLLGAVFLMAAFWPSSPLNDRPMRPLDRMTELARGVTREKSYGSWHQRLMIWSCAWDMVKERPLLGKGWGCFELFYPFYQGWYLSDEVFRGFRTHANNAHNVVLEIWSQTGTLGLGIFLWIAALTAALVIRRVPALEEERRLAAWALFAGGAGMMADNFFGNVSLFFAVPAFLFWWMTGSLARAFSPGETRVFAFRGPRAWSLAAVLSALCLGGAGLAYTQWKAEVHYFAGFKKAKQEDVKGAIAETEKSRAFRRWEVNNNYELANAYARQSRWAAEKGLAQEAAHMAEKALWAYDEALAANAGYDEIHFNKGTVLAQLGRADEAAMSYRVALLINPLSIEAHRALGNLYLSRGKDWETAADHFERAVSYFPRDRDFWNNLGYLYTKLGRHEKALEAYGRALRLDFQFEIAWKNLRVALAALGRKDHALLRLPALWEETRRAAARSDWAQARRLAEEAARLAPENLPVRLALAGVLAAAGDGDGAREAYAQVLSWEPGHWQARLGLGRLYLKEGDRAAARDFFQKLARERPQDPEVREVFRSLGEPFPAS